MIKGVSSTSHQRSFRYLMIINSWTACNNLYLQQINVAPGSALRPLYTKVPFAIDFRVYIFNVTNKDEVTKGAKPKLQQVGPYYFE